jgi:hypothetical protein
MKITATYFGQVAMTSDVEVTINERHLATAEAISGLDVQVAKGDVSGQTVNADLDTGDFSVQVTREGESFLILVHHVTSVLRNALWSVERPPGTRIDFTRAAFQVLDQ